MNTKQGEIKKGKQTYHLLTLLFLTISVLW